jgi:hypothetical protein
MSAIRSLSGTKRTSASATQGGDPPLALLACTLDQLSGMTSAGSAAWRGASANSRMRCGTSSAATMIRATMTVCTSSSTRWRRPNKHAPRAVPLNLDRIGVLAGERRPFDHSHRSSFRWMHRPRRQAVKFFGMNRIGSRRSLPDALWQVPARRFRGGSGRLNDTGAGAAVHSARCTIAKICEPHASGLFYIDSRLILSFGHIAAYPRGEQSDQVAR